MMKMFLSDNDIKMVNTNIGFNKISLGIYLFLTFSSIIVTIYLLLLNNLPPNKSFLPLLPLAFSLGMFTFFKIYFYIDKKISLQLIVLTFYLRMVIVPFFMQFSSFERDRVVQHISEVFNTAIGLMIYEYFCVFILMALFVGKFAKVPTNNVQEDKKYNISINRNGYRKFKLALYLLTIFAIFSVIFYPQILNNYKFFVFLNEEQSIEWYRKYNIAKESVPLLLFYLSTWTINIIKNIWVLVFILYLRKRKLNKFHLYISLFLILLNSLFSSGDTAYSIYFSMALLLILIYLYPNYKKKLSIISFITIAGVAGLGLLTLALSKDGNNVFYNLSQTLQAYFSGPINVAVSLTMVEYRSFYYILSDFLISLPLIRTFFTSLVSSTELFNQVMFGPNSGIGGQIIPSVGLGYFYFGFILAPIFSCLFVYYSMRFEYKAKLSTNVLYKFLYQFIMIVLALMPVLYNYYIFLIGFFTFILPTWIIIKLVSERDSTLKISKFNN